MSVLIPACNAAATLQATLDSIRRQTLDDWEVLVIDDGSTDGTAALVQAQGDARMRCIRQPNGGIAVARNRSCDEARGDYLAFLDADDLAHPERLAVQAQLLDEHPDIDLCFTDFTAFDAEGPLPGNFAAVYYPVLQREAYRWDRLFEDCRGWTPAGAAAPVALYSGSPCRLLAHGNFIHPPTVMLRRSLWTRTGPFDTRLRSVTEWEWFVRAARAGRLAYLDRALLDYRRHPAQITGPAHVEHIARDVLLACETIAAADPALLERDRAWFRRDLCHFHWTLANVLANRSGPEALCRLSRSLACGWPGARGVALVLAKALTPRPVLDAARQALRRWRPVRG